MEPGSLWCSVVGGRELKQEGQAGCKEKPFPHEDSRALEQVAPQGCTGSVLGDFKDQALSSLV